MSGFRLKKFKIRMIIAMKKICFITTVSMTLRAFLLETAEYLHCVGGYEIFFICAPDESFEMDLPEYVHFYPVSMKRGMNLDGIKAVIEMKNIFEQEKFDIIQYSTPNASCYAALAGAWSHVPIRLYCQWGIAYVGFTGMKRHIFKILERIVCKLSTWIEPDSFGNLHFSHNEKLYTNMKSSVIWNGSASGVNLAKFNIANKCKWRKEIRSNYNLEKDAKIFIFVGRIKRDKGINELFAATKSLMERYQNLYLFLVGSKDGEEQGIDTMLYDWSQNEERVLYCGFSSEVEKYLAASDVYVLPSYREGFGSSVIEAEAMGLPVIVTNIPGPTDAMLKNKTGLVVEKADYVALQYAMERLYLNTSLQEEYGINAHAFAVENFEQNKLVEKILNDRNRLIGEVKNK